MSAENMVTLVTVLSIFCSAFAFIFGVHVGRAQGRRDAQRPIANPYGRGLGGEE